MTDLPPALPVKPLIVSQKDFSDWSSLNDTIMGGSSQGKCTASSKGLVFHGELIEDGGGFASCRSNIFIPPLNLSGYKGLQVEVEGEGRTLKMGISCKKTNLSIVKFSSGGLKWVAPIPTKKKGLTVFRLPFDSFEPSLRAKPINLPLKFDSSCISQFQILHSKFGRPGKMNPIFMPGTFKILVKSINAYL